MKRPIMVLSFTKYFMPVCVGFICFAALAADEPIPSLLPPHDEIHLTFWERYGWLTLAGSAVVVAAVVYVIDRLLRPKPGEVVPPEILARQALENLHGKTENAALVVEVSQIFRRYVLSVFGLAPDELTTDEIRRALQHSAQSGPDLAAAITDFLHECDERKFAPAPPAPQAGVVDRALALLEKTGASRRRTIDAAPPPVQTRPVSTGAS